MDDLLTIGTHCHILALMKVIRWNSEKNLWLIRNRGVCFEQCFSFLNAANCWMWWIIPIHKSIPGKNRPLSRLMIMRIWFPMSKTRKRFS